jgi:hypothetical protein
MPSFDRAIGSVRAIAPAIAAAAFVFIICLFSLESNYLKTPPFFQSNSERDDLRLRGRPFANILYLGGIIARFDHPGTLVLILLF